MQRLADAKELLDGELDRATLAGNLRDLARVNRWLGGSDLSWRAIRPFLRQNEGTNAVHMLDVGTGAADIPRRLLRLAAASGLKLEITATDIRSEIVAQASQAGATPGLDIATAPADGMGTPDGSVDVVHASLLLHHLEPAAATRLLAEMSRAARTAVIVNDLDRAYIWWVGAWLLSHVATANRYTRHDAPLSVRRAYRPAEIVELAATAGLRQVARYRSRPGYRYALVFVRADSRDA